MDGRLRLGAAALCLLSAVAGAEKLTADEIATRIVAADAARAAKLAGYTSERRYFLENKRFATTSELNVSMRFRAPQTKEFTVLSTKGSSFIRKRVFQRMLDSELAAAKPGGKASTQIGPANYTFELIGSESLDGRDSYVLKLEPKTKNIYLFRGRIWVDAADFAVAKIEGEPAQNPSVWMRSTKITHRYQKAGELWLPLSNRSQSEVVVFGTTTSLIDYGKYQIELAAPQLGTAAIQ